MATYENVRKYRVKLKMDVISAYGGRCSCCNEAEIRFLTLDHVNDDGAEHRRSISRDGTRRAGYAMWIWARANGYPDTLQLLCWNCNCGRNLNGGVCPHLDLGE